MVWESHEARWNHPARRVVQRGVRVVAISDAIKEDYVKFGVPASQMHVAYDGIDESFFDVVETKAEARSRLGLPSDAFIVMYIGGLDGWKGAELLMQASAYFDGVECVIIGGRQEEVESFSMQYPDVHFLGARPYSELRHNQQAADVLVIPNSGKSDLSARYTSPLKLFSYLASGVPVVAADVPSITSVTGRESVLLFTPDSVESLLDAVELCRKEFPKRHQIAEQVRNDSRQYTWSERAAGILRFLVH